MFDVICPVERNLLTVNVCDQRPTTVDGRQTTVNERGRMTIDGTMRGRPVGRMGLPPA